MTRGRTPSWVAPTGNHWDWQSQAPPSYRNRFWDRILGNAKTRDVFLALQNARKSTVLTKKEIAERVRAYPSFEEDDTTALGKKISDNNYIEYVLQHGGGYEVPKVNRSTHPNIVRLPAVLDWLINPVHAPLDETVAGIVQYVTAHAGDWSFDPGFSGRHLPLKAYLFARVAEHLDYPEPGTDDVGASAADRRQALPTVEIDELAPYQNEDVVGNMRGFRVAGSISGEELTVRNRHAVDLTLLTVTSNLAMESTDRKSTSTVDFRSVDDGGDCDWHFEVDDGPPTRIDFTYTLHPRVNM